MTAAPAAPARREDGSYLNREGWLTALAQDLEPLIKSRTGLGRASYRIACGWPSRRGTVHHHRRIGECWTGTKDDPVAVKEIFISPTLDTADDVAHVVAHELLHAFLPPGVGHRKPFSQAAKKLGLVGKPTATEAGEELAGVLRKLTDRLGAYPHEAIALVGQPEKCRNLKFICPGCGYIGRSSAYWLDSVGAPICPDCMIQMVQDDELEVENPLVMLTQTREFQLPGDDRFRILSTMTGRKSTWRVLDYEPEASTRQAQLADAPADKLPSLLREMIFEPVAARQTPAESRQDALDLIEGLRSGLTTYEMLEAALDTDVEDIDTDEPDDETWLLHDGEPEIPDYPEDEIDVSAELAAEKERQRARLEQVRRAFEQAA